MPCHTVSIVVLGPGRSPEYLPRSSTGTTGLQRMRGPGVGACMSS